MFLGLPLFSMTLAVLRSAGQIYPRPVFCWDLSDDFLMIRLRLYILGEEDQRGKVHFYPIILKVHINMIRHS